VAAGGRGCGSGGGVRLSPGVAAAARDCRGVAAAVRGA